MAYNLNLNLRQRSAIRVAISIWERRAVKEQAAKFFAFYSQFNSCESKTPWRLFTKFVTNAVFQEGLPKTLEAELFHFVKMIGESIYNWYQYITYENESQYGKEEMASNYMKALHWTSYGAIDVVQTLKSSWIRNPCLSATKVYNIACSYALEEHVCDLWNDLPIMVQENFYNDIFCQFDRHILAYWEFHRNGHLSEFMTYLESVASDTDAHMLQFDLIYDSSVTLPENMLRLAVHKGYSVATKYFWNQLTEEQKTDNVLPSAGSAVDGYSYYESVNHNIRDYLKGQYIEICLFLMNYMTTDQKALFFNSTRTINIPSSSQVKRIHVKNEVLKMLLSTSLLMKLFIPVFEDILRFQDDNSLMSCLFLETITYNMVEEHRLGYCLEISEYRSLLHQVWVMIPAFIKQNIVREDLETNFICHLIDVWDLNTLKLILNDPALADAKDEFISFGLDFYERFVFTDRFDKLDEFIEVILKSEEEKKAFKKTINVWHSLIDNTLYHLLDKLLCWQCATVEEKQCIKNNIDDINFCKDFIETEDYDLADKLLNWKFETVEERKKCKDHFKDDQFSIEHIFDIWKKYGANEVEAITKSNQFLHWFLGSNEEISLYKKEKITRTATNEFYTCHFLELHREGSIDSFIDWCSIPKKTAQKIKRLICQYKYRWNLLH